MVPPALADVVLAGALTALSLVPLSSQDTPGPAWAAVLLAVLSVAPLAVRQRMPVLSMTVVAGALAAYAAFGLGDPPSNALGLVIAMFTVAMLRPRAVAAAMFLVGLAVFGVVWLSAPAEVAPSSRAGRTTRSTTSPST